MPDLHMLTLPTFFFLFLGQFNLANINYISWPLGAEQ